ncbi:MAG: response regulator [candidate division NC10 bacterium]|nr:response regulator [candidate division NC10 bacterium]
MAKVLVVDDDVKVLDLIARFLGEAGHRVTLSNSGQQALKELGRDRFDLVISDDDLIDLPGLNLLKQVKALDESIPVLLLSTSEEASNRKEALRLGALDYLMKPFELNRLLDILQKTSSCPIGEKKEVLPSSVPSLFIQGGDRY